MKVFVYFIGLFLFLCSSSAFSSSSTGNITKISFASSIASTSRPGSVQFSLNGGFNTSGCNQTYAAISKEDTHLISLLLMAKAQNKSVEVFLDTNSKYFSDRCLVNYLELQ